MEDLILKIRMTGFDKPEVWFDDVEGVYKTSLSDPTGQWKCIRGNSPQNVLVGSLRWIQANQKRIKLERDKLLFSYRRLYIGNRNKKQWGTSRSSI